MPAKCLPHGMPQGDAASAAKWQEVETILLKYLNHKP
jgi:hypothetical protein